MKVKRHGGREQARGHRIRSAVVHPSSSDHSGDAPQDLREGATVPTRAKNGKTISVEGTLTREQFYAQEEEVGS